MEVWREDIDGYTVLIEAVEAPVAQLGDDETPPVARGDRWDATVDRLDQLGGAAAAVCSRLYAKVRAGDLQPDELTLEFSISLAGEMGIPLISKASGEGTLTVSATWTRASDTETFEGTPPRSR